MKLDLDAIRKQVWARGVGGERDGNTLVLYLCYEHYLMGDAKGDGVHHHWVLPAKEGCACIVCQHAALLHEVERLQAENKKMLAELQRFYERDLRDFTREAREDTP